MSAFTSVGRRPVAGWEAGLIQRAGNDVLETAAQPDHVGHDLNAVADQIIARHAPGHG